MWHQSAIFEKIWPPFCQIWNFFTHLKWVKKFQLNNLAVKWLIIVIKPPGCRLPCCMPGHIWCWRRASILWRLFCSHNAHQKTGVNKTLILNRIKTHTYSNRWKKTQFALARDSSLPRDTVQNVTWARWWIERDDETQFWVNVGPESQTMGQHRLNIGLNNKHYDFLDRYFSDRDWMVC